MQKSWGRPGPNMSEAARQCEAKADKSQKSRRNALCRQVEAHSANASVRNDLDGGCILGSGHD